MFLDLILRAVGNIEALCQSGMVCASRNFCFGKMSSSWRANSEVVCSAFDRVDDEDNWVLEKNFFLYSHTAVTIVVFCEFKRYGDFFHPQANSSVTDTSWQYC